MTSVGIVGSNNTYWTAGFKISNTGPAVNNVKLTTYCMYHNKLTDQYSGATSSDAYVSLDANQKVPTQHTSVCPGHLKVTDKLWSATMIAYVPVGDANPKNNSADAMP